MPSAPYYKPGRYWGRITNQQLGESSTKNPQVVITFQVLGMVNLEDPDGALLPCGEHYDRSVFRSVTDKTVEWVVQDMEKLGFSGDSFAKIDLNSPGCCDLRGTEAAFTCQHEPHYQTGVPHERWSVAGDGAGLEVKPLDSKALRQLDAMFGKYLKKGTKPAAPVKAAETPPVKRQTVAKEPEHPFPDPNAQLQEFANEDDSVPF